MSLRDDPLPANTARVLDFPGFYESILSQALDQAEEREVENLAEHHTFDEMPYEAFMEHSDYGKGFDLIARANVDWLNHVLEDTGIVLAFESMRSPREYNFGTDVLFVQLNDPALLYSLTDTPKLNSVAAEFFTSGPGFHSFYSPDVSTWGELPEWDHNQLGALLTAYLRQVAEDKGLDSDDMLDWMNEDFSAAVDAQVDWTALYAALGIEP